jgi:hypothetical protein
MSEEDSQAIEAAFAASWDQTEHAFRSLAGSDPSWRVGEWATSMLDLISQLRQQGYDRKFRARLSRAVLILSCSRTHGMRPDQAHIEFHRDSPGLKGVTATYSESPDVKVQIDIRNFELTPQLEDLLQRLLQRSVD